MRIFMVEVELRERDCVADFMFTDDRKLVDYDIFMAHVDKTRGVYSHQCNNGNN